MKYGRAWAAFYSSVFLRNFAVPNGTDYKFFLFRINQEPIGPISTTKVARERFFYSRLSTDGSKTLDDRVTDYENKRFTRLISGLLRLSPSESVGPYQAAEVVAHLTARSAHLRTFLKSTLRSCFAEAADIFLNEANLRVLFGADAPSPPLRTKELIASAMPLNQLSTLTGLPEALLLQIVFVLFKENFDELAAEVGPTIQSRLRAWAAAAPEAIRDGHNRALDKNLDTQIQANILTELCWLVLDAPEGGFDITGLHRPRHSARQY